jgi:cell wall-associated NlpC family hydrolase
LVALVYKNEFNIKIPTYENEYHDALDRKKISEIYTREMQIWIKTETPKISDIVVCRVRGQPWHTGIVVAQGQMLHTQRYINAAIEHYDRFTWKNRVIGFWKYYK